MMWNRVNEYSSPRPGFYYAINKWDCGDHGKAFLVEITKQVIYREGFEKEITFYYEGVLKTGTLKEKSCPFNHLSEPLPNPPTDFPDGRKLTWRYS